MIENVSPRSRLTAAVSTPPTDTTSAGDTAGQTATFATPDASTSTALPAATSATSTTL